MLKGEGIRESSGHHGLRKRYDRRLRGSIGVSGWLGLTPISRYGIRRVGSSYKRRSRRSSKGVRKGAEVWQQGGGKVPWKMC